MAVLTLGAQNTHAQSSWTGGTGDWNVNTNWTPTVVPNSPTTNVSITGTSSLLSSVTLDNLSPTIQNLSLDSFSTLTIQGQSLSVAGSTISNAGQINVGVLSSSGVLYVDASTVTLSGAGTVSLNNPSSYLYGFSSSNTLVNQSTIQGQGYIYNLASFQNAATVNANVSGGTLSISGSPTTNTGTLEATGRGTLYINGSNVANTGGTIFTDSSSKVIIESSTITGGNLTSASGAEIHGINSATLQGVTITSGSTYSVDAGQNNYLTGDLTNKGTVVIGSSSGNAALYVDASTVTLSGAGTVSLNNPNSYLEGYSSSNTLVNQSTIQGQGYIYGLNLNNQGTVNANVPGGTLSISSAPTTNMGTLKVQAGATLNLASTTLTNFESTGATAGTLSGGTYQMWSGTLSFNNGGYTNDIVTNAATILLDGTSGTPNFIDQNGKNALAHFATNAAAGNFTIQNGVSLTSASSDFNNAGTMNIGANSTFTVGGGNNYIQSGGLTYLQFGTSNLVAGTTTLNGGVLQGFGTVTGNLSNLGGTVHPGDGPGILTVTGSYTQDHGGALNTDIAGANPGIAGYSQLNVGGSASLDGTLNINLLPTFTPFNHEEFVILTSTGLTGVFSTVNGLQDGNVTFTVEYSPPGFLNDVVLDASVSSPTVPEPASWLMLGLGLAAVGTCVVRKSKCQVRGK